MCKTLIAVPPRIYGGAAVIRGGAAIERLVITTVASRRFAPAWTSDCLFCSKIL
jgi:hypothetical protein